MLIDQELKELINKFNTINHYLTENTMASKSLDSLLNEISALTVLELNELVEMLQTKFGVSAAMSMSAGAAAADAGAGSEAKAEEKTEYKVELLEAGDKMKTIKALRQVKKDLGLIEAKKMAEEAPVVVAEQATAEEAKALKEALEAAGAKVKLS